MSKFDEKIEDILNNDDFGAFGVDVDTVICILEELKQYYEPETNN